MDALDIIPLATAKNWISVDDTDTQWDADIQRLIRSAVEWVETYTGWRLYQRTETLYNFQVPYLNPNNYFPPTGYGEWSGTSFVTCSPEYLAIALFPFTIESVQDSTAADVQYTAVRQPLKTLLYAPANSVITLQTGFALADVGKIPQVFIDACLKMVTDMFENRDNYTTDAPTEVQTLLNKYRRGLI